MLRPVLEQRAKANPDVQFVLAGPPRLAPLFEEMGNIRYLPTEKHQPLRQLYHQLAQVRPDCVADMHHVLRTIGVDWLFRLHGVRVGRIHKRGWTPRPVWQRYDKVLTRLGLQGRTVEGDPISPRPPHDGPRRIGVAPFARHKGKEWPLPQVEELVRMLSQKGYEVFLFGGAADAEVLNQWTQRYEGVRSAAGCASLRDELRQMEALDAMVSMDSANMHLASCLGIPVVSVWGATHPITGFYGWRQQSVWAVQLRLPCRPCSRYGSKPCRYGDYRCLTGIPAQEVIQRIESLLTRWEAQI